MTDPAGQMRLRPFVAGDDDEALVGLLAGNRWPFHVRQRPDEEWARGQIAEGEYDGTSDRTFWVEVGGERAGFVRAMELGAGDPQVDIRLAGPWRGRGIGRQAVAALVVKVFGEFADVHRIEGVARRDNVASRRTLRACGFVKEAVYRRAYEPYVDAGPDAAGGAGSRLDAIGYALLRSDWEQGTSTPVDWDEEP